MKKYVDENLDLILKEIGNVFKITIYVTFIDGTSLGIILKEISTYYNLMIKKDAIATTK